MLVEKEAIQSLPKDVSTTFLTEQYESLDSLFLEAKLRPDECMAHQRVNSIARLAVLEEVVDWKIINTSEASQVVFYWLDLFCSGIFDLRMRHLWFEDVFKHRLVYQEPGSRCFGKPAYKLFRILLVCEIRDDQAIDL